MSAAGVSLEVVNLRKSWGDVEVLRDVNFSIDPGGFLTLLGPSGCGKSTILRLVSGLDEVSGGQILIGGKDVARIPAAERNIGMVFQNYALFPHMTIAENISYGLTVRKVPRPEKEKAISRVADLMALGQLLDRKPAQLSGGQQQRVALARVLVSDRPLVLMDEPLSNLDAKLRVEIRSEIRSLNKKLGITVVYVTHDQSEALSMSDKVVLMNAGEVSQVGTPQQLYDRPANTFAAGFIGTPPMNLLEARDVQAPATLAPAGNATSGDILFGVRPESLTVGADGAEFTVSAHVESIEYEGKVFLLHLVTPSGARFVVAHSGDGAPEEGAEITAGWHSPATHLFSKSDGSRMTFTL
ncbi:ABC transporter ATP-binding protein [Ovoidimarina sediminis]|uniref:ABC transporter ATP-binding protein n=1 Tax=Ovoidimarina sediminis TaxID=3079856 RepID=UPI00291266BD|nr:ABC transporter ATP-binding protein [Rhodophyticola sp. MJ-SS7]MDU8944164.1 ABC transporter ATP-binding protein [Rhodophyticola sp. MJ-SS7]